MCILGVGADRPVIAARAAALGAGKTASHQAPVSEMYDAARHVLATRSYQQAARRLARIIGQHDGAADGAAALGHCAGQGERDEGLWSLLLRCRVPYCALMTASRECRLADGRVVVLRLAGPGDIPGITGLYLGLSPESFYRRFNTEQPAPALVAQLASFEAGSACLVAAAPSDPGRVVAEARYVPIAPGTAELALTVADSYQGAGLGHLLLGALVALAREEGLERLRAVVLLANTPMLRLLQRYGWVLADSTEDFSVAFLEISTSGGMPSWPAGRAGRRVLVERRSWFDDRHVAALRSAGNDVRQCTGPRRATGRACPLVTSGSCRLAEQADLIVSLLPGDEPDCTAVLAAHRRRWPHRVAE